MQAKSIHGSSFEAVQAALEATLQEGYQPTLAIVFTSIQRDRKSLCGLLSAANIDILGMTSCGEFTDQQQSEGGTSMLLLDLPRPYYKILFEKIEDSSLIDATESLAQQVNQTFTRPAMILGSSGFNSKGEYLDGEGLIATLKNQLKPGISFFGGMAGDDRTLAGSYIFTKEHDSNNAVMALVLDTDKVQLQGMAITGWQKMGIARKVTKSQGTLLYSIDDQPAVDMYLKYLGRGDKTGDKEYKVLDELGMHYPFIVHRDSGETVLRTPMKIDHQKHALVTDLEMPAGTQLWFSMPPDFDIVDNILDQATRLKEESWMKAEALLIFSCAGRINVLGPLTTSENEGLQRIWKTPMAGFFTYGEYGPDPSGSPEFHSGACCWVALKEIT